MLFWIIFGIVVAVLIIGGIIAMLAITLPIADKVYKNHLVRTSKDLWGRTCSAPDNEEQLAMWNAGCEWADGYRDKVKEVSITNDGLKLYGEFFDFGSDKCVIILPGRCECLKYSYYFAEPYRKLGMNVLVVDQRAHGYSDGVYASVGHHESRDLVKWMKFIAEEFGIRQIWLHGVCIGSACALLAAVNKDCPDILKGVVAEGSFESFREIFRQHIIYEKKPVFPVLDLVMFKMWQNTKANVLKSSPIKAVKKIKCHVLFLYGEKDIFSIPPKSRKVFAACASPTKKIVWFDKGGHSHLRINNTEKYDGEIIKYIQEND